MKRELYLDNVCGLLMLNMIFMTHLAYYVGYRPFLIQFVSDTLSFFMLWFFFKGGMVFKSKPLWKCLKTGVIRLLIPFCVFNLIGIVWELYVAYSAGENLHLNFFTFELTLIRDYQSVPASLACWYLLSLFIVRIIFQLLHDKVKPGILIVGGLLFAYLLYLNGTSPRVLAGMSFTLPFYLGNISLGLAFYALGYSIKDWQYNKWIFALAICAFILKFFIPSGIDVRKNEVYGYYLIAIMYGVGGCIVLNNLFKYFLDKEIILLTHIGKRSMVYYLVHFTPIMIFVHFSKVGVLSSLDTSIHYFLMAIVLIVIMYLSDLFYNFPKVRFLFGG